jgi:fatty acid desaturase
MVAAGLVMILLSLFGWMLVIFNLFLGAVLFCMSPILFIIGLVLLIVGLVASSPQQPMQVIVTQQAPYQTAAAPAGNTCYACGRAMTYYPQKGRWYCHNCRRYR